MKSIYGNWTEEEVTKYIDDWFDIFSDDITESVLAEREEHIDGTLAQIDGFADGVIKFIPKHMIDDINKGLSILDWGCSLGAGTHLLQQKFPNSKVTGLDISEVSLKIGRKLFPECEFVSEKLNNPYDVIYCSNCLEHFVDPLAMVKEHLKFTNKYYIMLVPFGGKIVNKIADHLSCITLNTFPQKIDGFNCIYQIYMRFPVEAKIWNGFQMLFIYQKIETEGKQ